MTSRLRPPDLLSFVPPRRRTPFSCWLSFVTRRLRLNSCGATRDPPIRRLRKSVLPQIWIPGAKPEVRATLGARELKRTILLQVAVDLVTEARTDVEALLAGNLDVDAILAGKLKAPTANDVSSLAEEAA